ncbi:MAG: FAD-binding oxidoreductase [Desulfobacterales bacterium]|nr:FAD-binding oxidoreductase [Desulfobacterales bacterium]
MADATNLAAALSGLLGRELVKIDTDITARYAVDRIVPTAVVFPKNTRQVSEVITYANQKQLAVVPWGSGTKIGLGAPPRKLDIVLCTSRMNHMKDVDTDNLTITVEAGVKFRDIQARLATEDDRCYLPLEDLTTAADEMICSDRSHSGCFLPIDPPFSEKATIGGIRAANATGPRRLLYGMIRDVILGVRFVAPSGEIVGSGGKTVKNVSGYGISKLMVGSAGSLGVICEATLRLLPLPEKMETLLIAFDTLPAAGAFSDALFETKLLPAAVEVMNARAFNHLQFAAASDWGAKGYVAAIALESFSEAVERMRLEILAMAEKQGARAHAVLPEERHPPFWLAVSDLQSTLRTNAPNLISAQLNYPIARWKDIALLTETTVGAEGIEFGFLAHTGSGLCHVHLMINGDGRLKGKAAKSIETLLKGCREAGGNLIVQSAPVELKPDLPLWGRAGSDLLLMKRIKQKVDPLAVMSPGRFVAGL